MHLSLLIRKRLLLNLYNSLWMGSVILLILASGLTIWSWVPRHHQRLRLYEADHLLHKRKLDPASLYMYSWVEVGLDRAPEKLSLFAEGTGERYGSCAAVKGIYTRPRLAQRDRENFFLSGVWPSDLVGVLIIFVSFIASLVTYNTICGERESGTLSLTLSNSVPRYQFVIAEWLAALATFLIPLAFILLGGLLISRILGVTYSGEEIVRLALIFFSALAFISAWALLGIGISSGTRSTATAIVLLLLVWVFWILLYPRVAAWLVRLSEPTRTGVSLEPADVELWLARLGSPALSPAGVSGTEDRARALLQEQALNENLRQAEDFRRMQVFSPALSFQSLAEAMARTDLTAHMHYHRQIRTLDENLRLWQGQKLQRYPDREYGFRAGQGPLDLEGLPVMQYRPPTLLQSLKGATAPLTALVFWNLFFFLLALTGVRNYDPRTG
jgi:ABC-type transport system involved in multi-copper enzyme maturation permease subunit